MTNPFCVAAAALTRNRKRGDEKCEGECFADDVVSLEDVVALFRDADEASDHCE